MSKTDEEYNAEFVANFKADKHSDTMQGIHDEDSPDESPFVVMWRGDGEPLNDHNQTGPGWYYGILVPHRDEDGEPDYTSPATGAKYCLTDEWHGPFQASVDAFESVFASGG